MAKLQGFKVQYPRRLYGTLDIIMFRFFIHQLDVNTYRMGKHILYHLRIYPLNVVF